MRGLAVNRAADALRCAKDLLDTTSELLCERFCPHCACNVIDLVERNVAAVLDVLLLLAVAWGLCNIISILHLGLDIAETHP